MGVEGVQVQKEQKGLAPSCLPFFRTTSTIDSARKACLSKLTS